MSQNKEDSTYNNSLSNDLEEDYSKNDSGSINSSFKTNIKDNPNTFENSKDDIFDMFLRGCYSLIPAIFTSAAIAGFIEIAQGWEISAGSFPMIILTIFTFTFWYWLIKIIDSRND